MDNDAFLAFVQGPASFDTFCMEKGINDIQTKNALAQFYGLSLGVLYRLKRDWHCENANKKAPKWFNKDKCEYFGKCLVVLYEYLAKVRAGHEVERPAFHNTLFSITFVAVLDRLAWICNNFLIGSKLISKENVQKWKEITDFFLDKEQYYETKPANAVEATNFEKILAKMYQKAEDWVKLEKGREKGKSAASFYDIILDTPAFLVANDGQFIDFIKDEKNFNNFEAELTITDAYIFKYKIFLGLLYLMKNNWHCANAKTTKSANECAKLRHYLDIFYEYLLRVRFGLPAVRPMFQTADYSEFEKDHFEFDGLSKSYFGTGNDESPPKNLKLTNENELNYKITDFSKMTLEENVVQMAQEATDSAANETQQINGERLLGLLRHKFDKELEAMQKRMVKMALEEKSKLEALKAKDQRQLTDMEKYDFFWLEIADENILAFSNC